MEMSSALSPPLSFGEHGELARELRQTQNRMRELRSMVVSIYGSENRAALSLARTVESIERLRLDLQVQASLDCPGAALEGLYRS